MRSIDTNTSAFGKNECLKCFKFYERSTQCHTHTHTTRINTNEKITAVACIKTLRKQCDFSKKGREFFIFSFNQGADSYEKIRDVRYEN